MGDMNAGVVSVRALSIHADYACAHSGACCRAGWTIPVEAATHAAIAAHLDAGRLARPRLDGTGFVAYDPDDRTRFAFAHDDSGACVFLEGHDAARCTIHRDAGEAALPAACRQFPRVAVLADDLVDVTLSHFCPTAAARLVDWTSPLEVIADPPCARGRTLEGLDTRQQLPPLLRPDVLHSLGSWRGLELAAISELDRPGDPARHLAVFAAWLDRIETWSPARGPLEAFVARVISTPVDDGAVAQSHAATSAGSTALADWHRAWRAVPPERARPPASAPSVTEVQDAASDLRAWDAAVGRYLAAKVLGSWVPWLASRSTTLARALRVAHHVLIVEATRGGPCLDRAAVVEAVRRADQLLVHLADTPVLIRHLERVAPAP